MRWAFVFLCLALSSPFHCISNGAPPVKVRYSREEEEFIAKQLESCVSLYNRNMWTVIAKAHENKVKDEAPGFSKKRSADALRKHFGTRHSMMYEDINVSYSVKLLRQEKISSRYSQEEREFINTELPLVQGDAFHSGEIWKEMKKKHDIKRESGFPGFQKKRSVNALRTHCIKTMVRRGLIDETVKERFSDYFKARQGSNTTKGANVSDTGPSENMNHYTNEEIHLVIDMLESHASMYSRNSWKIIEEAHKNRVEANAPGFATPKSADVLQQIFIDVMRHKDIKVPGIVKQLYDEHMSKFYTSKEREFINTELPLCQGRILGVPIWIEMEKRHDEKRQSDYTGFHNKRTWRSLRTHFHKYMVQKGFVSKAVKQRFKEYFKIKRGPAIVDGDKKNDINASEYEESDITEEEVWVRIKHSFLKKSTQSVCRPQSSSSLKFFII